MPATVEAVTTAALVALRAALAAPVYDESIPSLETLPAVRVASSSVSYAPRSASHARSMTLRTTLEVAVFAAWSEGAGEVEGDEDGAMRVERDRLERAALAALVQAPAFLALLDGSRIEAIRSTRGPSQMHAQPVAAGVLELTLVHEDDLGVADYPALEGGRLTLGVGDDDTADVPADFEVSE